MRDCDSRPGALGVADSQRLANYRLTPTLGLVSLPNKKTDKVIEACPDAEWRLIFALSRYGGLRCPSEHLSLQWGEVDWERGRMRVRSPKTEHHVGSESRVIPIFPELKPHLEAVFDEAEDGSKYVITRYRAISSNLRTQLNRIIRRAGLKPWSKPFQNLRSSRETELAEEFPMHVICGWIGNSQPVAMKHYLQITDEHFERAIKGGAESGAQALRNPMQQPAALSRTESLEQQNTSENAGVLQVCTKGREAVRTKRITRPGLEPGIAGPKPAVLPLHHRVVLVRVDTTEILSRSLLDRQSADKFCRFSDYRFSSEQNVWFVFPKDDELGRQTGRRK